MPTYKTRLTPDQIAKRVARRKAHRELRIKTLREYAAGWKDPVIRESLLARSAFGRKCIQERKQIRTMALQRFLSKQPMNASKERWISLLASHEMDIVKIMTAISPGTRAGLRAKSAEHLFRKMVRTKMLTLNVETQSYENNYVQI